MSLVDCTPSKWWGLKNTTKGKIRMRLNRKKFQEIVDRKKWTEDMICHQTGLTRRSVKWIMNNGEVSEDALERIADMAGVDVKEISLPDPRVVNENMIEFLKGDERATVTFSQERYKTRIRNLAKQRPGECQIVAENQDGSLCAHIPTSWIRIKPGMELTDEQREERAETMRRLRNSQK